jgi:hypothetical protein
MPRAGLAGPDAAGGEIVSVKERSMSLSAGPPTTSGGSVNYRQDRRRPHH